MSAPGGWRTATAVDVHVRWLRVALAEVEGARIVTVPKRGYRWEWRMGATMREGVPLSGRRAAGPPAPPAGVRPLWAQVATAESASQAVPAP